jgi:hypothetical protein
MKYAVVPATPIITRSRTATAPTSFVLLIPAAGALPPDGAAAGAEEG